jgi:hypothetical protein
MNGHKNATAASWSDAAVAETPTLSGTPDRSRKLADSHLDRNWAAERRRHRDPGRHSLPALARLVLDVVECHIAANAEAWATLPTIAAEAGVSLREAGQLTRNLERAGFLASRFVNPGGVLPDRQATRVRTLRKVWRRGPCLTGRAPRPSLHKVPPVPLNLAAVTRHHVPGGHPAPRAWEEKQEDLNKHSPSIPPEPPPRTEPPEAPERREAKRGECVKISYMWDKNSLTPDSPVLGILAHWRAVLWPELRGRLDTRDRIAHVLARLAEGFTAEDLRAVVDAARTSDWHMAEGQGQRRTASALYGSADAVERLLAIDRQLAAKRQHASSAARARERVEQDQRFRPETDGERAARIAAAAEAHRQLLELGLVDVSRETMHGKPPPLAEPVL